MNEDEVKKILRSIEFSSTVGDYEEAHILEDELYAKFIKWVAAHGPSPFAEIAKLVITAEDIEYTRWYA